MEPTTNVIGGNTVAFKPEQQVLFDLQEMSVNTTKSMTQLKKDLKEAKQMLKDIYAGNNTYVSHEETTKAVSQQLKQTKESINSQPSTAQIVDKIKSLRSDLKEKEEVVSDYALEYSRISGEQEFEKDGEVFVIVRKAKLVSRPSLQ